MLPRVLSLITEAIVAIDREARDLSTSLSEDDGFVCTEEVAVGRCFVYDSFYLVVLSGLKLQT